MSDAAISHVTMTKRLGVKPGLFRQGSVRPGAAGDKMPLAITLPVTIAVSLCLWVGLVMAVRGLI